jgi:SAM-dependent methyltransferase
MRIAASLLLASVACGHVVAPPAAGPTTPGAGAASGPATTAAAPPTESVIIERSHAVLEAYDRGDLAALRDQLAPGFVRFDNQRISPRDQEIEKLSKRPAHPAVVTRTWRDQHAYVRANDAVFIGQSVERETGNDSHGNREFDGWYTMSWTRDATGWKVAHWTWQPHRTELERARDDFNEAYRQSVGFNHEPNRLLVDTIKGKPPGRALDLMMGQGRNAIYLATQGWAVTGIDIATEGLRLARAAAAKRHVALDAIDADAEIYDYGTAAWDLVTMIYASDSTPLVEKIQPSLRRGGLFVAESFLAGPNSCCGGFEPGQLTALFTGDMWEILRDDVVDDVPDWATDKATLVRFVARRK